MKKTYKVPIADIRLLKKNSSHIRNNGILPILDYIKFDNGTIAKTNLNEFVVQDSNFSGAFLVEELVLFNFIEYTSASDLLFTVDGNKIVLSDGIQKTTSVVGDITVYPEIESPPEEKFSLTDTILKFFGDASKYIRDGEFDLLISHVFVGDEVITASDRMIGFYRKIDRDLPKIALPRSVAERVSSIDPAKFSQSERKFFFQTAKVLYGFPKTEATYVDMRRHFSYDKSKSFRVAKRELMDFNDMCLSMSPSKICHPTFEIVDSKLRLCANDRDYGVDNEKEIDVVGKMESKFKYDAALMNRLLKTAPDDELTFHQSKAMFYITGDSGFTSLIMELS